MKLPLTILFLMTPALPVWAITIDTVLVGNPNNPAGLIGFGAVEYDYRIGTYEVTNSQYTVFLNAVAASDPLELYDVKMDAATPSRGGIARTGADGAYMYTVKESMGNKPVNFVSWYDAARFVNWLHNGQPVGPEGIGTTEAGTYTLLGGTAIPSNADPPARNAGATWFLPTENEWYKAAYYDPTKNGYWHYPTRSNLPPTIATANSTGDISNPGANVANYDNGANWNGLSGNLTSVGSAGVSSASFYGTFDQGGNISEMNESLLSKTAQRNHGGAWNDDVSILRDTTSVTFGISGAAVYGFRVASVVPEPQPFLLAITAFAALPIARRRG